MRLKPAFILACALSALPTNAILIRADRDDGEYLELATRYASAVALNAPDGEGALIAPRWVLTAARRAKALREMRPLPKLEVGGRMHAIQAVFLHPDWNAGESNDIALILLRSDAKGTEPTPAYRGSDETGKPVVVVGHGPTGKIGAATRYADRRKRAAINTVDRASPRTLGLRIKSADEASDLQGAVTPAESGAPAFIETREGLFVAGVAHGTEGEWETYIRVAAFMPWIEATMLEVAAAEARALLDDTR